MLSISFHFICIRKRSLYIVKNEYIMCIILMNNKKNPLQDQATPSFADADIWNTKPRQHYHVTRLEEFCSLTRIRLVFKLIQVVVGCYERRKSHQAVYMRSKKQVRRYRLQQKNNPFLYKLVSQFLVTVGVKNIDFSLCLRKRCCCNCKQRGRKIQKTTRLQSFSQLDML